MARPRLGIIVPALNEVETIGSVVVTSRGFGVVIVVDDGSSDGTSEAARSAGAVVVRHSENRGYDAALNSGFARAAELECEAVVTLDADGQHNPRLLESFVNGLNDGAMVVLGVRDQFQRFAEHLFARVAYAKWNIEDPLCGMKGYKMEIYKDLGHFDSYCSIGTELTIFAANRGVVIAQIPCQTRDRIGVSRFGQRLRGNWRILRSMVIALSRDCLRKTK